MSGFGQRDVESSGHQLVLLKAAFEQGLIERGQTHPQTAENRGQTAAPFTSALQSWCPLH